MTVPTISLPSRGRYRSIASAIGLSEDGNVLPSSSASNEVLAIEGLRIRFDVGSLAERERGIPWEALSLFPACGICGLLLAPFTSGLALGIIWIACIFASFLLMQTRYASTPAMLVARPEGLEISWSAAPKGGTLLLPYGDVMVLQADGSNLRIETQCGAYHFTGTNTDEMMARIDEYCFQSACAFPGDNLFAYLHGRSEARSEGKKHRSVLNLRYGKRVLHLSTDEDGGRKRSNCSGLLAMSASPELASSARTPDPFRGVFSRITLHGHGLRAGESFQILFAERSWADALAGEGWKDNPLPGLWLRERSSSVCRRLSEGALKERLVASASNLPGGILDVSPLRVTFQRPGTHVPPRYLGELLSAMDGLLDSYTDVSSELSSKTIQLESITVTGEVFCGFCGDLVDPADATTCPACETPHHPDCWSYHGGCTTYACSQRPSR